jgi:hypothetical protein
MMDRWIGGSVGLCALAVIRACVRAPCVDRVSDRSFFFFCVSRDHEIKFLVSGQRSRDSRETVCDM